MKCSFDYDTVSREANCIAGAPDEHGVNVKVIFCEETFFKHSECLVSGFCNSQGKLSLLTWMDFV